MSRHCRYHHRPTMPASTPTPAPDPAEQAVALAMAMRVNDIDAGNVILSEVRDPFAVLLMMAMMTNLAASDDKMADFGRGDFWYPPQS